jgi:hypothetical protein
MANEVNMKYEVGAGFLISAIAHGLVCSFWRVSWLLAGGLAGSGSNPLCVCCVIREGHACPSGSQCFFFSKGENDVVFISMRKWNQEIRNHR